MSLVESVGGTINDLLVVLSHEKFRVVSIGAQAFRMNFVSKQSRTAFLVGSLLLR